MRDNWHKNTTGFTLVEMTMVLVVVGLVIGFGYTAWLSMKNSQQISAVKTTLRTVSECLTNYVLHSEQLPPQTYFTTRCRQTDPWGNSLLYENTGDNVNIALINPKTFRDSGGDFPDGAWMIISLGPDQTRSYTSSATLWDCSTGDDLCYVVTKNALLHEITN